MENEKGLTRLSSAEMAAHRARGEDRTDFTRVRAKTEADIERDIASDPDFKDVPENWYLHAKAVMPKSKRLLSLRLDNDVIDWFKKEGPGYQTRMNAVLRAFIEQDAKKRA